MPSDQQHHAIPIHKATFLIGQHDPVGIAIEGKPDVRPFRDDAAHHLLRMERAAVRVDVHAIRSAVQGNHLSPEIGQHTRPDLIARPIRAVEDNIDTA